jgi:hypothetical protein
LVENIFSPTSLFVEDEFLPCDGREYLLPHLSLL